MNKKTITPRCFIYKKPDKVLAGPAALNNEGYVTFKVIIVKQLKTSGLQKALFKEMFEEIKAAAEKLGAPAGSYEIRSRIKGPKLLDKTEKIIWLQLNPEKPEEELKKFLKQMGNRLELLAVKGGG